MIPFTGNPLDRAGERRGDAAWQAEARGNPRTRVILMWKFQPVLAGEEGARETELLMLGPAATASLGAADAQEIFLGVDDGGTAYFARDISGTENPLDGALKVSAHIRDGRAAASLLPLPQVAIMGQAKALLEWHARHPFCACCGAATQSAEAGYKRICGTCKAEHFPRTDPAVIMLATYKDSSGDYCLLGHNVRFPVHRYSTLAGFVEPGESFEEAVRREILEEVGLRVGDVRYFGTQPWPFPASVMIGCFAEALSRDFKVDGIEIEDARWFDRATILRLLAGEKMAGVEIPQRQAIAHHLIRAWAEGRA